MAGRSYASNLSGLLNGMAGTIGSMGKGGSKYVDTFRRSMAPYVDKSDSASLMAYADWARRNGYAEEAQRYTVLANQQKEKEERLEREQKQANTIADVGLELNSQGGVGNIAIGGDTRLLREKRDRLFKQLAEARASGDPTRVTAVMNGIKQLNQAMPIATNASIQKKAAAIDEYQALLDSGTLTKEQQANIEKYLAKLQSDPEVAKAYQEIKDAELKAQAERDRAAITASERKMLPVGEALTKGSLTLQQAQIDDIPNDRQAEQLRMTSQQMELIGKEATLLDKQNKIEGQNIAASLIEQGIYDIEKLPKGLNGAVRSYAIAELDKAANAKRQGQAVQSGQLTPFDYSRAQRLAEGNPAFAQMFKEYERIQKLSPDQRVANEHISITQQITKQLNDLDGRMAGRLGDLTGVAAGELAKLRSLDESTGWFEGSTYKKALQKEDLFNEMSRGLAEYMQAQGITQFNNYVELYAAMDAVAPTLASQSEWSAITNKNERLRDQGRQDFESHFKKTQTQFREDNKKALIEAQPMWEKYPKELDAELDAKFKEKVDQIATFFDPSAGRKLDPSYATGSPRVMTPQQRMIMTNSDEWASVVDMVGDEWAAKIRARVMAGYPVGFEDYNWSEDN